MTPLLSGIAEIIVPIAGIIGVFGIPISAIWATHRQKMMEMQLKLQNQGSAQMQASLESLRDEVRQLRDTTMQYDISFDTALQRMEQRVEGLERRVNTLAAPTEQNAELRAGRP